MPVLRGFANRLAISRLKAHAGYVTESWFQRAWTVVSDLLIATALIWSIPLALGVVAALAKLLLGLG